MDLVAYDERNRRFVPGAVAVAVALVFALLCGVSAFLAGRASAQSNDAPAGAGTSRQSTAAPATGSARTCPAAMSAADHALADATQIEQSVGAQTTVMNDLAAGRISASMAVDRGVPSLIVAARAATQYDQDVQVFRRAATRCS